MSERKKSDAEIAMEKMGHYQRIGKVASAWSTFELNVDATIWAIAGTPQPVGACLTAQLIGPAKRFDALICLVRLFKGSDALLRDIQSFAGRASGIGEERNRVLHDAWFVDGNAQKIAHFQITARRELTFGLVEDRPERLDELAARILDLSQGIHELGKKIKAELAGMLGKHPEWPVLLDVPD